MTPLERDLGRLLGPQALRSGPAALDYLHDMTEMQGLGGHADAIVAPASVEDLCRAVRFCCERGVAMVPRGGGSGFAGGAVPLGGVVISTEQLNIIEPLTPDLWRIKVQSGVTTARIQEAARTNGLYYPPDPGAPEQSQIGGNIACNAGGPHSFKYGVTGDWVTGLDVVIDGGQLLRLGGANRKDVAPYDLAALFTGSEGTLGIIAAAQLRLIPRPEVAWPLLAAYPDAARGCAAIRRIYGYGLQPAIVEFLDEGALLASRGSFPDGLPPEARFLVITEADGSRAAALDLVGTLTEALAEGSNEIRLIDQPPAVRNLWRWRNGVSFAVRGVRGGKMSEDVAVPVERLESAIQLTDRVGRLHGLPTASWGHAGDGNLHSTFLVDANDRRQVERAASAAEELFEGVRGLEGTASGEHGLGLVKRDQLPLQLGSAEMRLQTGLKRLLDPSNLFNPGKKVVL